MPKEKFDLAKHSCRPFDDMQGFVNAIRRTQASMCWGSHAWTNIANKALRFHVTGRLYRGWIIVSVNAMDTFDIFYVNRSMEITKRTEGIYLDQFIEVVDSEVETPN